MLLVNKPMMIITIPFTKNKKVLSIDINAAPNPPGSNGLKISIVTKKTIGVRSITTKPDQIRLFLLFLVNVNTMKFIRTNVTIIPIKARYPINRPLPST